MAASRSNNHKAAGPSLPALTPEEQKGLQDYWKVYEAHRAEIRAELLKGLEAQSEFKIFLQRERPQQSAEQEQLSTEIQRKAIYDGDWGPYLERLQAEGRNYARAGLRFGAWMEMVTDFRQHMRPHLLAAHFKSPEVLLSAMGGIDKLVEISLAAIGESYLDVYKHPINQQSEDFLRLFVEGVGDAAIFMLDPTGRVITWNAGAEKIKGYRADEIIGQHFSKFYTDSDLRTGKPDKELATARENGQYREEGWRVRKDGSQFIADVTITALYDKAGDLRGFAKLTRDTTERMLSERKYRGLIELAPDAIIVVNAEGNIEIVNAQTEKMFGYLRRDLIGQSIETLIPERFREGHIAFRANYAVQPVVRPMGSGLELYGRRSDGSEFAVEISLSPLETEQGQLVTAAIRDVTERKQIEHEIQDLNATLQRRATELEVANRELESFSYSVSHDLRSPLRSIDGFSQALLEDYREQLPADAQDFLARVRSATQRMAKLIDDLLELSRISRIPVEPRPIDLSALAHSIADELQEAEPTREVTFKIAPQLEAHGDTQLLRIAMQNLMNNAWKFTSKVTAAQIEIGRTNGKGPEAFFVRDNGAGFDMSYANKLFGAFQRLHAITEFPGTGIGLATVQRIIDKHGGRIWAESVVDQGATFYFTLQPEESTWKRN
jgi:PAS domain S-box-containing protein